MSESESEMARLLELSDQEFLKTVINTIRVLMEKIENMQEQIENVCRQVEILRKNLKDMQEIKKKKPLIKDMKNVFNVLISRWEKSGTSLSLRTRQQKLLKLKSKE